MNAAPDTADPEPGAAAPQSFSKGYLRLVIIVLFLIEAVAFMERVVIHTIGQSIKADLGLSDLQLGILSGFSFVVFYSTMGLPIARMVERYSRKTILVSSVGLFSLFAALCATAGNYVQLLAFRSGVGIGEAGVQPTIVSIVADYFEKHKRGAILTIIMLGIPFGSLIGAISGGMLAEHLNWRAAFIVVAAPGLLLTLIAALVLREPRRGAQDAVVATGKPPPFIEVLRFLAAKRSFLFAIAGVAFATMGIGSMGAFTHPYLVREYGTSVSDAAVMFGISSVVAVTFGMSISGFGSNWLARQDTRWYVFAPAIGTLLSAPLYFSAFQASTAISSMALITAASMCSICYSMPTLSFVQNLATSQMRATTTFFFYFVGTLVGHGLGPILFGWISDIVTVSGFAGGDYAALCTTGQEIAEALRSECLIASSAGARGGSALVAVFMVLSSLCFLLASRTIKNDIAITEAQEAAA